MLRGGLIAFAMMFSSLCVLANTPLSHDAMTERLGACTSCHGKEGRTINAEYLPRTQVNRRVICSIS